MASLEDGDAHLCPNAVKTPHMFSNESEESGPIITVTIGATVPTGFEHTAAEEVQDKIGVEARVSKDRGRIYFQITSDKLYQAHLLRSVDNLFVVVEDYDNYQFKESKEDALMDLQQLSSKLPWNNALEVWRLNNSLKKKRGRRRGANGCKGKASGDTTAVVVAEGEQSQPSETHSPAVVADGEQSQPSETHSPAVVADGEQSQPSETHSPAVVADGEQSQPSETHSPAVVADGEQSQPSETHSPAVVADGEQSQPSETHSPAVVADGEQSQPSETHSPTVELSEEQGASDIAVSHQEPEETGPEAQTSVIKFRVTCNRAGDKHSFSSNEAARDFGGAVQEFFQWKADMTKFDIEVLLNIHNNEVVIGIALTEESLHRRNITHFGPTTLRSTLCYGMLRLCNPQPSDIILDPMCGTGAIPLEGAIEFHNSFYVAGDNNDMAVSRTVNNICHFEKRREEKGSAPGLPINTVQLDVCHLPIRTGFVDVIITDMPFGKRMGSRKRNWDLYPSCLTEMARVCRPGSGKAILLTQDKKCFAKAISRMGGLWRRTHTVWVNVGGLHAGVFLLRRTPAAFGQTPEDGRESQQAANTVGKEREHS